MTDRERLLEQVREAEKQALDNGRSACYWMRVIGKQMANDDYAENAARKLAMRSTHHALTALALRDVIAEFDNYRDGFWVARDGAE